MATVPVKHFTRSMQGAPQVTNNWGDVVALLDATLVTGFNTKTVTSLTFDGGLATATIGSGHGFVQNQVIVVSGVDQSSYNTEAVVTATTSGTVTFPVSGSPTSPATTSSTITIKVAPLGWEKVFSGTNKAVYRSADPQSTGCYLRVDNALPTDLAYTTTWAKFARVSIGKDMTDIDTFVGYPAPYDPAWPSSHMQGVNGWSGWLKWYAAKHSSQESAGDGGSVSRNWFLVGDSRSIYFAIDYSTVYPGRPLYGFGDFVSYKSGDPFGAFVWGHDARISPSDSSLSYAATGNQPTNSLDSTGKFILKDWTGLGYHVKFGLMGLNIGNSITYFGKSADIPYPNGPNYGLLLHPLYIRQTDGHIRGVMPGLYQPLQNNQLQDFSIIEDIPGLSGRKIMLVKMAWNTEGFSGQMGFDITGPWR